MSQITLLTGDRRRLFSQEQKLAILEEAFAPGAHVAAVARRHEISTGQLYTWRRKAMAAIAGPAFVEAVASDPPKASEIDASMVIRIEMATARISISGTASPALVSAVLKGLR